MTTETTTTNHLPPCPLPDCEGGEGGEHHFHDVEADCATRARDGFRCYGPHQPGLSERIDLPEITDEMVDRAVVTYVNTYYAYDAGSRRAAMRAALTEFRADLIAGIPQWQPIEYKQIKAGMRIRATIRNGDLTAVYVGVAHHQPVGTRLWCTEEQWPLPGWGDSVTYEVDPATIPDPDAELIEKIGKAIHDADESAYTWGGDEWGEDPSAETYRKLARAALTVIRESEGEA